MKFPSPQYFGIGDVKKADRDLESALFSKISGLGERGRWPLITSVLEAPQLFKIKSPIRQEILLLVGRTMEKIGFSGSKKDKRIGFQLWKWMKVQEQRGGLF
jgi:hypothetical protein